MSRNIHKHFPHGIRTIGIFFRDGFETALTGRIQSLLKDAKVDCRILGAEREDSPPDVIISLGGDGTLLHALALYPEIPMLPINFGHIGFLTAGSEEEAEEMLRRLLDMDCYVDERVRLISEFRGVSHEVINEVIVKGTTRLISVEVYVDDALIHTIRGDGAIVGTPTGSTSYLLATGSSIVAPQVPCIIINGINEYRFASRSLILPADSRIRLHLTEQTREHEMFISHDGRDKLMCEVGDEVLIRKADKPARLIFFEKHSFFRNLKSRLDW